MANEKLSDEDLVEHLKDVATDQGLSRISATRWTGRDTWRTFGIQQAAVFGDSPDGWDVEIADGDL